MKVLHVIPSVAPQYGGPSKVVYEMSHAVRKEGVEPRIATTNAAGDGVLPVSLGSFQDYRDVPTIFFQHHWSESFKYSYTLSRWLHGNVDAFDVVHVHAVFSHSSLAGASACRRAGVPYLVRPFGSLDPWSLEQRKILKTIFLKLVGRRMLQGASAIHYTTEKERQLAEQAVRTDSGVVVPLGLTDEWMAGTKGGASPSRELRSAVERPYVLVLSRLHPKKRIKPFIEVFLDVARTRFPEWTLVIAGDGDSSYGRELKQLVSQKQAGDRVVFPGWVDGDDKRWLLENAELSVLPSHQENFGISVIEAMSYAVPVLISDRVNVAPDVREARAGWVAPRDHAAFTNKLSRALDDREERRRRGRAAKTLVREKYVWSDIAGKMVEVYQSIEGT